MKDSRLRIQGSGFKVKDLRLRILRLRKDRL